MAKILKENSEISEKLKISEIENSSLKTLKNLSN